MDIGVEEIVKLRIAIARLGEMDCLKWWNTKGLLSGIGAIALSRGFPKTQVFARARAAFAVASTRSDEVFNPVESFTLWRLPVSIEDRIEDAWANWLETPDPWKEFVEQADALSSKPCLQVLSELDLVSEKVLEKSRNLRRADDYKSVPIKLNGSGSVQHAISLLAAAHSNSETGKLAVPYVRMEDWPA